MNAIRFEKPVNGSTGLRVNGTRIAVLRTCRHVDLSWEAVGDAPLAIQ